METNAIYYEGNLFYTVNSLHRQIAAVADAAFIDLGLTPSDAYLIMCVNEKPNIQPTEISEKIQLAPSTITRMVEKLEKRNIVKRRHEGKYSFIAPTQKGEDMYSPILQIWDDIRNTLSGRLTSKNVGQLLKETDQAAAKLSVFSKANKK